LAEPHRLAVALADAVMTRPGDMDDATVAALRAHYSADELVELTLKVLKFNAQKVMVALGTHSWIGPDQINTVRWNQDGTYVVADA
jgi:alkylhydroperoxidase family enzyme